MNKFMVYKNIKKLATVICAFGVMIGACGCGSDSSQITSAGMVKVGSLNVETDPGYTDISPRQSVIESVVSEDGLCRIDKYDSYYDVTLEYDKGTPYEVGAAYAQTILKAVPDYEVIFEPYLYENIRGLFNGRDINYDALEQRILTLEASIRDEYRQEIEGFASAISGGVEGYAEDGELSYIEAITMQMIPDALRPTACSALTVGGSITETGSRISLRNLEWFLGSASQMTQIHAVEHLVKGEKSITAISVLGLLDMITAVNDNGVMIGILDVGTVNEMPFVYEGKKCYTYEIRYALENFDNAKEAAEFLNAECEDFTWCHNLLVTDEEDAFCCENPTREAIDAGRAVAVIRTCDSELMEGLTWDTPDALCIVNTYATAGNQDGFTGYIGEINRFVKYNNWVKEIGIFSLADMKGIMAREIVDQYEVPNVHNSGTVHTVIVDYATGDIHVAFTSGKCADDIPEYILVGNYGEI
ncbi:MAG: hypothetical protein J6X94_05950 [Lachnospiraceae bacterium]|nr:hypothetical protein [Lachnospiraceae bacterium]